MNGYIHICLLVISSPHSILHSRVPEPLTSTFSWKLCILSSLTSVKWFHSHPFLGEECLVSCFLAFICFPLCAITTPSSLFTCITSLFRLYYLLQRQLIADFTLVFLSLTFLNSILPNRAKLILSSVLRLFTLSCLHPQKIWDPEAMTLSHLFSFSSSTV